MTKALQKPKMEGMYLNIIKAIYDKPTTNIIPKGETLKTFPPNSGVKPRWSLFELVFNTVF